MGNNRQVVKNGNTETVLEFVSEGFRAILLGDGVKSLVESATSTIESNANAMSRTGGFESSVFVGGFGGGRWVGSVGTTDYQSMRDEAEDKVLERAIGR